MTTPNDPIYALQWHLDQLGDIETIWDEFTGDGVTYGIYDDGIEATHPDLAANYNTALEVTIDPDGPGGTAPYQMGPDLQPGDFHGTSVAGLIAADHNGIGTAGIAHDATVTSVDIFGSVADVNTSGSQFNTVMNQMSAFDIVNHSWGNHARFVPYDPAFDLLVRNAWQYAAENGRGGLGTIIVKAAGNDYDDANNSAINVSPYTIVVGAYSNLGYAASYSNYGANLLVSAPGSEFANVGLLGVGGLGIVTTDRTGTDGYNLRSDYGADVDYTDDFGGTSAATPIVSGVIGLMLEAATDPDVPSVNYLGWRDVQTILSYSARHIGSDIGEPATFTEDGTWFVNGAANWNNGGLHYSIDYGYGAIDAYTAVRMAEIWGILPGQQATSSNDVVATSVTTVPVGLPAGSTTDLNFTLGAVIIETIVVQVTLSTEWAADYRFELIAPDGTSVQIANLVGIRQNALAGHSMEFAVQAFRGQYASGSWTLRVIDGFSADDGAIESAMITVHGSLPTNADTYHYTNEFADMLALQGTRGTLSDTDGGTDWINAAAVSSDIVLDLNAGGVTTFGGATAFTIASGTAIERAITGDGDDIIIGNGSLNVLYGMRGNDSISGGIGNDTLYGGAGNDTLNGGSGNDVLNGGEGAGDIASYAGITGNVTVSLLVAGAQATGGAGSDTLVGIEGLIGGSADDQLTGNDGDNYLEGGLGNDTLDGRGGHDVASYAGAGAGVTVSLGFVAAQATGGGGIDLLTGIESLIGSAYGDTLTGDAIGNTLRGGGGNDLLNGASGDDTLQGDEGNDTLTGGFGADRFEGGNGIDVATFIDAVTIDLSNGAGNTGEAVGDIYSGIERFIGSAFNDLMRGLVDATDWLSGADGADTLYGYGGNDTLLGGIGNDVFYAGLGFDVVNGGAGTDRVAFLNAVILDLEDPFASTGEAEGDFYTSIERFSGSNFNDTLRATDADEFLYGNNGNDTLDGRGGNDRFFGGGGADVMIGGDGIDAADYRSTTVAMTVNLAASVIRGETFGSGPDGDVLRGIENVFGSDTASNVLTGDDAENWLTGGAASDTIYGGGGVDRIDTYGGADLVSGGLGADRIVFEVDGASDYLLFQSLAEGGDVVSGFETGGVPIDRIMISRAGFGLGSTVAFGAGLTFETGTTATAAGPVVLWNDVTDRLIFDANGSLAGGTTTIATLSGVTGLTEASFLLLA